MKQITIFGRALIVLLMASCALTAMADWHSFWHELHVGYHRNNAWPDPFNEVDSLSVVAPFQIMKTNGWRLHNTIGHEKFREGDGALLASGQKRVHWIATQAPVSRRQVYVVRGRSQQETEARVASVHDVLSSLAVNGPTPAVLITDIEPSSASGAWATQINREMLKEMAPPKLPKTSASGTAAGTAPN